MININCPSRYLINRHQLKENLNRFLDHYHFPPEKTINLVFVGKTKMRQLSKQYKDEDVALPVLAFSYGDTIIEDQNIIGEAVICYPQAVLLAAERGKQVDLTIQRLAEHGIKNILTEH